MASKIKMPPSARYHFFKGTSGILTIHSPFKIEIGDTLLFGTTSVFVTKLQANQASTFYKGLMFYQLKFEQQ